MIDGKTLVCGLIGNPVSHTLSPVIHNNLAEIAGIDLTYVPFPVAEGKLEDAVKGADALGILGCNVTVPYKSDVIKYLNSIDPLAAKIGAVNTLVRDKSGGFKGYNTDMLGLERALGMAGISFSGKDIVITGAGGAARAVSYLCAERGAAHIYQLNRNLDKVKTLADEINEGMGKDVVVPMSISDYQSLPDEKMTMIQATSVGLSPHDDEAVICDDGFFEKADKVFDLIYRPAETKFMRLAHEHGAEVHNGLRMLLFQGIISFELWNDVRIDNETAEDVYSRLEKELGNDGK